MLLLFFTNSGAGGYVPGDYWPLSLPQRLSTTGYQESMADNLIRTQMDVGPAKVRRRSSAGPRPLSGSLMMTNSQLETMLSWIKATLLDGSLTFYFPNPRPGADAMLLVRFAKDGLPSWTPAGFLSGELAWEVALRLEVLP